MILDVREYYSLIFFDMLTEKIHQQIVDHINSLNPEAFVVDITLKKGRISQLMIRVDTDQGISMAELGAINRSLGPWLDEQNVFDFEYAMEISSPGVGEPLRLERQYRQNLGRDLKVSLAAGGEITGKLESVDEDSISVRPYKKNKHLKKGQKPKMADTEKKLLFEDIKKSIVII
jgi:ribosome maturation factor RimP